MSKIQVLIVDDDPTVADIHRRFVSAIEGFEVYATARNGKEALDFLERGKINLVILDIFMPELDGLEVLHKIRTMTTDTDIIIISAAQEGKTIQNAVRLGVFDYLLKPFDFSRFKKTMDSFRENYQNINEKKKAFFDQGEIDLVLCRSRIINDNAVLPKGIQKETLDKIVDVFKKFSGLLSVEEVAQAANLSRVTVMRYVKFLLTIGDLVDELCYQEVGRPVNKFLYLKPLNQSDRQKTARSRGSESKSVPAP